jgi:hypothetical protein
MSARAARIRSIIEQSLRILANVPLHLNRYAKPKGLMALALTLSDESLEEAFPREQDLEDLNLIVAAAEQETKQAEAN